MAKFIEELYYGNINPQERSTESNKTLQDQMEWVAYMNNIHSRVTEIVNAELIFA